MSAENQTLHTDCVAVRLSHVFKWQAQNQGELTKLVKKPKKNPKTHAAYMRNRAARDAEFKILTRMRGRMNSAIRLGKGLRMGRTMEMVGCSIPQLKAHLEAQFKPGMSWDNYGKWHIDHIRPCASYDMTDEFQQRLCFNYMNLQPLWAMENFRKSGTYRPAPETQPTR